MYAVPRLQQCASNRLGGYSPLNSRRAFRKDFAAHRRIARWTFPIWVYVSVTGVVVYVMLYWIYGARA